MARLIERQPDDQDHPTVGRPWHKHPHLVLPHTHTMGGRPHFHTPEPGCNGLCLQASRGSGTTTLHSPPCTGAS